MSRPRPDLSEESPDEACARIAAGQHGLISLDQARQSGLSKDQIRTRIVAKRWERLLPRVFRIAGVPPTWRQALVAVCIWAGEGSAASHRSAAAMHGLAGCPEGVVEITVPRRLKAPENVILHRTVAPSIERAVLIDGIPVTPVARTLLDLGAVAGPLVGEAAVEDAIRKGLVSPTRLRWELDRYGGRGKPGAAALQKVLEARGDGSRPLESLFELKLLKLIRASRLPIPHRQYEVRENGQLIARVDFAYPGALVAIEADGFAFHSGRATFQTDRSRQNALTTRGWVVLRFTWADIHERPDEVVTKIRIALELSARNRGMGDS